MPVRVTPASGTPLALNCEAALPLTDLPAGAYVVELTARTSGGRTITEAVAIHVK